MILATVWTELLSTPELRLAVAQFFILPRYHHRTTAKSVDRVFLISVMINGSECSELLRN